MAELPHVLLCALTATLLWTGIGMAPALLLSRDLRTALPLAPALGWAVHGAIALPVLTVTGFTATSVAVCALALLAASLFLVALWRRRTADHDGVHAVSVPALALLGALMLAAVPASAILPKISGDAVHLGAPIFDHAKIAIVDAIARQGLPPVNPVFSESGTNAPFAYYYLWHFSAAELRLLLGISGWEADAGQTWFTAFASLALTMALAVRLSGHRLAACLVLPLAFSGTMRPLLALATGDPRLRPFLSDYTGLSGWLYQSAWAPQHLASACCVVLSVLLLVRLRERPGLAQAVLLGLVAAAGVQSSTWVGGIAFLPIAAGVGLLLLMRGGEGPAPRFLACIGLAAVLAAALALPMLRDQIDATAMRGGGFPFAVHPFEVLGPLFPQGLRRLLDLPAYWLVLLPLEFPAIVLVGLGGLIAAFAARKDIPQDRRLVASLAAAALASFGVAWLLASTIGNNDLGWRGILPGLMILVAFGSAGMARWVTARRWAPLAAAAAIWLLAVPSAILLAREYRDGFRTPLGEVFAGTPAMWQAVRRHAGPGDRVANNPLFLKDATPWYINISWALLGDRPSCFAGREMALPFAPLPAERRAAVDAQFIRVFAGNGTPSDLADMAGRYGCKVVVLTPQDGAWTRDPFAADPLFELVEDAARWRIYRVRRP